MRLEWEPNLGPHVCEASDLPVCQLDKWLGLVPSVSSLALDKHTHSGLKFYL